MSLSFAQSMQSLHADRGRFALWGVGIAMLFLLLWLFWFFTPSLTVTVQGHLIKLTRGGILIAEMAVVDSTNLQAGQTAYIYPTGTTTPPTRFTASVLEVATNASGNQLQIALYPSEDIDFKTYFASGVNGNVEVQAKTITPATLLLQTLQQWGTTSTVPLNQPNNANP